MLAEKNPIAAQQLQRESVTGLGRRRASLNSLLSTGRQQRQAPLCSRRRGSPGAEDSTGLHSPLRPIAVRPRDVGAQRMQRGVGDEPAPDQAPQRFNRLAGVAAAQCGVERIEETCAGGFKKGENFLFALREWVREWPLLRKEGQLVSEKQGDAAVPFADGLDTRPRHFARSD